ncbi:RNA polymerase sigma factor [Streptomyces sp. NPDC101206]|uniref:RNA polymerase sigma factor n=1 Tax=Streptomyces sp. NPDC101206 TaxID=3366128 RepID=UPI0037F83873
MPASPASAAPPRVRVLLVRGGPQEVRRLLLARIPHPPARPSPASRPHCGPPPSQPTTTPPERGVAAQPVARARVTGGPFRPYRRLRDASLTALRRIGDVRDGAATGAWLRAVVRNDCLMRLRASHEVPGLDGLDHLRSRDDEPSQPERHIERHALRDWIWEALEGLPQHLRLVLMLRHFSGVTSYQEMADACEVPVGTVRSRLSHARARMAQALAATASQAHGDAEAVTAASRDEAVATPRAWETGGLPREISELWPAAARPSVDRRTGPHGAARCVLTRSAARTPPQRPTCCGGQGSRALFAFLSRLASHGQSGPGVPRPHLAEADGRLGAWPFELGWTPGVPGGRGTRPRCW